MKNVVLLGKGSLAIKACEWINSNADFNLLAIVPDKPEPTWTESISDWALANNITLVSSGKYQDIPKDVDIDLAISIFYGKIIKTDFIKRCGDIINLHNSPLPKYRGVRPINWALKNEEDSHGVTIHRITEGIDDGPILGQVTYPIYAPVEEVKDVYEKALDYGWLLFKDVMNNYDYAAKNAKDQIGKHPYYHSKDIKRLGNREDFTR